MSNYLICKKVAQTILIVLIFANSVSSGAAQSRGEDNSMIDRVSGVKKSTFRILVNGQPSGTGFAVSRDGLILTSFHVVQLIQQAPNNQVQISIAPQIEVQTEDGTKYAATVHPSCQNAGLQDAISHDLAILVIKPGKPLDALRLGTFKDADEGAHVYSCGYPYGLEKSFVSSGLLSTRLIQPGYLGIGGNREVALLDMTINKGMSGGPIVLVGKIPNDDRVIGIANFTVTPLGPPLAQLVQTVQNFPGRGIIMGMDFKQFTLLIKDTFERTSVGMGGCLSIDYATAKLK